MLLLFKQFQYCIIYIYKTEYRELYARLLSLIFLTEKIFLISLTFCSIELSSKLVLRKACVLKFLTFKILHISKGFRVGWLKCCAERTDKTKQQTKKTKHLFLMKKNTMFSTSCLKTFLSRFKCCIFPQLNIFKFCFINLPKIKMCK